MKTKTNKRVITLLMAIVIAVSFASSASAATMNGSTTKTIYSYFDDTHDPVTVLTFGIGHGDGYLYLKPVCNAYNWLIVTIYRYGVEYAQYELNCTDSNTDSISISCLPCGTYTVTVEMEWEGATCGKTCVTTYNVLDY